MTKGLLAALAVCWSALVQAQSDGDLVRARIRELDAGITAAHPRLLLKSADVPALRSFVLSADAETMALVRQVMPPTDSHPLPAEPVAVRNGSPEGTRKWQDGYKVANEAGSMAQREAFAWLVTQDPVRGREAARWLMHLASWKMDREVLRTNDELFIQHLRPMIFAYDWAQDALTPAERDTVRTALVERLTLLAGHVEPKFSLQRPTPPDNSLSHPMRFISTLGLGGLALYRETPDAAQWLAWSYEYYLRQFPVWGGPAGGWAEGLNYWATGITQHQRFLECMAQLGFDAPLKRTFWRNTPYFAMYGLMPYAGSSFGDLTNIMGPTGSIALTLEKAAILNNDPYPLAYARALHQKPPGNFAYYTYDPLDALLQRFRAGQNHLPEVSLVSLPQSRYFDDIGVVTMHSALGDAANDIMLGFRSSPQGSASHGFADQNSFVLNAYGQPLAINSGYREYYDSAHHVGWARQTKSKNAVLFGGEGQRIKDATATGTITRFVDSAHFTFATGDARAAYSPHATQALRHVFFVNRRYFIVFDELAAPAATPFQWMLHAREKMELQPAVNEITQQKGDAHLTVRFLQPVAGQLTFAQTDAFDPPVLPEYRKKMPNEWHATVQTRQASAAQAFITLLYPWRSSDRAPRPLSQALATDKGYAVRVLADEGNTLVLLARENEKQVRTRHWSLDGVAASIEERTDHQLRLSLVQVRTLDGRVHLRASQPLSGEAILDPQGLSLQVQLDVAQTLQLAPGFAVRSIEGATDWRTEADGSITMQLAAGSVRLRLLR